MTDQIVLDGDAYTLARTGPIDQEATGARPAYDEGELPETAPRIATNEQGYGNLDPRTGGIIDIADLSAGFGASKYTAGRYWYSENADCRIPGLVLRGPRQHAHDRAATGDVAGLFEHPSGDSDLLLTQGPDVWRVGRGTGLNAAQSKIKTYAGLTLGKGVVAQGQGEKPLAFVPTKRTTGGMPQPYRTWDGADSPTAARRSTRSFTTSARRLTAC